MHVSRQYMHNFIIFRNGGCGVLEIKIENTRLGWEYELHCPAMSSQKTFST